MTLVRFVDFILLEFGPSLRGDRLRMRSQPSLFFGLLDCSLVVWVDHWRVRIRGALRVFQFPLLAY